MSVAALADDSARPGDLVLTRCPVCRRALDSGDSLCPRCGSDLTHVRAAYDGAWADVLLARSARSTGDLATARAAAQRAVTLVRCPATLTLWESFAPGRPSADER